MLRSPFYYLFIWASILFMSLPALAQSTNPTLVFPIEDQIPPLAHVAEPFNFTLFPDTFTSTTSLPGKLVYSTEGLPNWASFASESLTFSGMPTSFDEGRSRVKVTASDGERNRTSVFTLLVVSSAPAVLYNPIANQLTGPPAIASAVQLPSERGVLVHPYYSFSLGFMLSTLLSPSGSPIFYSALTTTSTRLPDWLHFNNETLTFYGNAPAAGSWEIVLTGSEIFGFGGVKDYLSITVGLHALDLLEDPAPVRGLAQTFFSAPISIDQLRLDGKSVAADAVTASISLDGYDEWLRFDASNFTLLGTPPTTFINGTDIPIQLPITFSSLSTNATISGLLPLSIQPFPFKTFSLPNLTAQANSSLTFGYTEYLVNSSSTSSMTLSATFDPAEASEWLTFDAKKGTLSGTVPGAISGGQGQAQARRATPASVPYSSVRVNIVATDTTTGLAGTLTQDLVIKGAAAVAAASSTSASSKASASSTSGLQPPLHGGLSTASKIVIGSVIGGIFLLVLLFLLVLFCCVRRRRQREAATAEARENEKRARGADGMTNVELGGNDRFTTASTRGEGGDDDFIYAGPNTPRKGGRFPFLGAIGQFSPIHLGQGVPVTPSEKNSGSPKKNRFDAVRGIFGGHGRPSEDDNVPPPLTERDVSGLPSNLSRSASDASFFSGVDPNGSVSHLPAGGIDHNNARRIGGSLGGIAAVAGARGASRSRIDIETQSVSDSPTFSSIGGRNSRASWESDQSYRWRSGDVQGSGSGGSGLVGTGASRSVGDDSETSYGHILAASNGIGEARDGPRPRHGFALPLTPTAPFFTTMPTADTGDSLASSAFRDASTDQGHSYPRDLDAQARHNPDSDGFTSSPSGGTSAEGAAQVGTDTSTSFGSGGSVASPLGRFGDPGENVPAMSTFAVVDEDEDDNSRQSFDDAASLNAYPYRASNSSVASRQLSHQISPNPSSVMASSVSSRPRPRLIPSRERLPTISTVSTATATHLSPNPSSMTEGGEVDEDSFLDADDDDGRPLSGAPPRGGAYDRTSVAYSPSQSDLQSLGYPATSAIYYSNPPTEPFNPPHTSTSNESILPEPTSTLRAVYPPSPTLGGPLEEDNEDALERYLRGETSP